jgi:hypothetical protein
MRIGAAGDGVEMEREREGKSRRRVFGGRRCCFFVVSLPKGGGEGRREERREKIEEREKREKRGWALERGLVKMPTSLITNYQ